MLRPHASQRSECPGRKPCDRVAQAEVGGALDDAGGRVSIGITAESESIRRSMRRTKGRWKKARDGGEGQEIKNRHARSFSLIAFALELAHGPVLA